MEVQKPLKYFDLYTKQPSEEIKSTISRSSSTLQLVPKASRHRSRHVLEKNDGGDNSKTTSNSSSHSSSTRIRIRRDSSKHTASKSGNAPSRTEEDDGHLQGQPVASTSKIPLTTESLARHTAMTPGHPRPSPQLQASPLKPPLENTQGAIAHSTEGEPSFPSVTATVPSTQTVTQPFTKVHVHATVKDPPSFSNSKRYAAGPASENHNAVDGKRRPPLPPALLEVSPPSHHVDIFAGPSSPVSAESLINLAVSETQLEIQLAKVSPSSSSTSTFGPSQSLDRLKRSASNPACSTGLKSSETSTSSSHNFNGLPRSNSADSSAINALSLSAATARQFLRRDDLPVLSFDSDDGQSGILSIDDIVKAHYKPPSSPHRMFGAASSPPVPSIPARFRTESQKILSIDEIVQRNSPALSTVRRMGQSASPVLSGTEGRNRSRTVTADSQSSQSRSSIDSITGEVLRAVQGNESRQLTSSDRRLQHARSQPAFSRPQAKAMNDLSGSSIDDSLSEQSRPLSPMSKSGTTSAPRGSLTGDEEITQYIRSPRLTRLLSLRRPPNHHLVVSLADVGSDEGHPVVVFLGLGSVRYLVALYDELAESLGLRLICIDRWGLGKTGSVPDNRRGFPEWATVVEEVLDQLGIDKFSIVAHSAGAPYALASSLRLEARICGSIQLLAPWVISPTESAAGSYKWLKFVPAGVIKTAQAAEWKMQAWRLGKMPKLQTQGVGFDPRAPLSSQTTSTSPIFADFQESFGEDAEAIHGARRSPSPSYYRGATTSSVVQSEYGDEEDASYITTPTQDRFLRTSHDTAPYARTRGDVNKAPPPLARKASSSTNHTSARSSGPGLSVSQSSGGLKGPKVDLGTALMRASHAESLKGGTSDLLTILQRNGRAAGVSYADVERPVSVWHGLKDEKISLPNVMTLESIMPNCKVNVIPGADHSLMTNVPVFVQVMKAIASEWQTDVNKFL